MSRLKDIISGWSNLAKLDPRVEEIAKKRLAICVGDLYVKPCAFFSSRHYEHCRVCGCPISAKVRSVTSTNKCPLGKWQAETINIERV